MYISEAGLPNSTSRLRFFITLNYFKTRCDNGMTQNCESKRVRQILLLCLGLVQRMLVVD